jgi:hypothetical protein
MFTGALSCEAGRALFGAHQWRAYNAHVSGLRRFYFSSSHMPTPLSHVPLVRLALSLVIVMKKLLITLLCLLGNVSFTYAAPNRLLLVFYYPWYGMDIWNDPVVSDRPLEPYASSQPAAMVRHIAQAQSAHVDAFVSAWYGPQIANNQTETNLQTLLTLAQPQNFKIAVEFETNSPFFQATADVKQALEALYRSHAQHPAYLRWNGKPVVFFWGQASVPRLPGQSALATWQWLRAQVDPQHTAIWVSEGTDLSYLGVFDAHHLYNIAWSNDLATTQRQWAQRVRAKGAQWVGTVMPGWDDTHLLERQGRYRRDRQNGAWYRQSWAAALATNPDWLVITSWNEFVENTYIEPSVTYGSQYLDLTRALAGAWKGIAPARPAAQSMIAPTPTATKAAAVAAPKPMPTSHPLSFARVMVCGMMAVEFCLLRD